MQDLTLNALNAAESDLNMPRTYRSFYAAALGAFVIMVAPVRAECRECSAHLAQRAEYYLDAASRDWKSLRQHFLTFAVCDDGGIGAGYSEAVVSLLARSTGDFKAFLSIARKDAVFSSWAVAHIDATTSESDLKTIVKRARHCESGPRRNRGLCSNLRQAAEAALNELDEVLAR